MSRNLDKTVQEPEPKTCQVVKNSAGYFCVRCNWRPDSEEDRQWSCCPECGAKIEAEKRNP
jgi:DNA-directed RNA polymerase subunit RPC12/RpoP